ncbi:MAG: DUF177 domain-containing protein [Bacteroidaceae bacterium]|nr:DUF177 domain-containing protein [Bacteroidaceae bacterium]
MMDTYKIDLLSSGLGGKTFEYEIGDAFFAKIGGLIQRGNIHTTVACLSAGSVFKFQIHSVGTIIVPCDRCLADLELRIETSDVLDVKLGDEYADEGDCVVVPEAEGYLDLAQFIYEFIALSMPMSCCHEPGKCDDAMMHELSRHQPTRSGYEDAEREDSAENGDAQDVSVGEDSDEPVDSRWAALKQLKEQLKK